MNRATISARRARGAAVVGPAVVRGQAASDAAEPRRCRSTSSRRREFSQMTKGIKNAPQGRSAEAAGREGRRARSRSRIRRAKVVDEDRGQGCAPRRRRRCPSRSRRRKAGRRGAKPEPRSPKRSSQGRAEDRSPTPSRRRSREAKPPDAEPQEAEAASSAQVRSQARSRRCSTSATPQRRPRPATTLNTTRLARRARPAAPRRLSQSEIDALRARLAQLLEPAGGRQESARSSWSCIRDQLKPRRHGCSPGRPHWC